MSQSLSKQYIHIVFHVKKNRHVLIQDKDKTALYTYMGSIIKDNSSIPIIIGGTENHIHILCIMSKNIALSKLTEEIKRHSSRWIKTRGAHYKHFAWQGGYGGFSVSQSIQYRVKRYIGRQEEHHRKTTIRDELVSLLIEYGIDFDEKYLLED